MSEDLKGITCDDMTPSVKTFIIFVNTKRWEVRKDNPFITFDEIVDLAYGRDKEHPYDIFDVTYRWRNPIRKDHYITGILERWTRIDLMEGMVFNVSNTDKA